MTFLNLQLFLVKGSVWGRGRESSQFLRACSETVFFFRFTILAEEERDDIYEALQAQGLGIQDDWASVEITKFKSN